MVYLDNAATTYPKPAPVIAAMSRAMVNFGGNPGRAGHRLSMETAQAVFNSRLKCADFFGAEPENVIFTLNCTHALNLAIKGIISPSAHLITSDIEHNAVIRPVHAASKEHGISYSVARTTNNEEETVKNFERLIHSRTKAIVCTAASNVTGKILPLKELAELCRARGICFIIDAAQSAGIIPHKLSDGINIICTAGHKGLYGPMGTGLMVTDGKFRLKTIIEGGTGSFSKEIEQPEVLPDRFESGTINTSGAIALGAGIDFIKEKTVERIYKHEHDLCELFYNEMKQNNKKIRLYTETYGENRVPVVPFNLGGMESSEAAGLFSNENFFLRGGFHCAFMAHKKMGTHDIGAVRFAPSAFTTKNEVQAFIKAVNKISAKM
ncbi:MAG: aminotransferase class V-fold PLP-dependent enzyme [Oscillospiraceae bacterium]|nr:aminotransferase class V-fold PLP-dependent enzyme [Oscillospiraceae bacterium]